MYGSEFFTEKEFTCPCGCGFGSKEADIAPELIRALVAMRLLTMHPITINSGARCPDYNKLLGGKPDSAHLAGPTGQCRAADIKALTSIDRRLLMNAGITWGIKRIGIGASFLHIDVAEGADYPACYWLY